MRAVRGVRERGPLSIYLKLSYPMPLEVIRELQQEKGWSRREIREQYKAAALRIEERLRAMVIAEMFGDE